ncbi:MAG: right-handed parallel beta-helix repeat-containing protein [Thermodesulfobacteriota bacterium]
MLRLILVLFGCLLAAIPAATGYAEVLTADAVWRGEVLLEEDVVVAEGVTLEVAPGTVITVQPADSTKIDPEYLSHQTEITVRGRMTVGGDVNAPVRIVSADRDKWGGIIVQGGRLELRHVTVSGAETAIHVIDGTLRAQGMSLRGNQYGCILHGRDAAATLTGSEITENDYGLFLLAGARVEEQTTTVAGNLRKDRAELDRRPVRLPDEKPLPPGGGGLSRTYRSEALAVGTTVWQNRVVIDGVVRLPPEGRLVILPGTEIEVSWYDSNGDGIGENGLMIQGQLIAKGTPDKPVRFHAAGDRAGRRGSWDSINFLGSDRAESLLEYCEIADAYRGLHFHFSTVRVSHARLLNNYRGCQFQESLVTVAGSRFEGNVSAIQARDSQVVFRDNLVAGNLNGANFYRMDIRVEGNRFVNNGWDGLRIREGAARVSGNLLAGNRFGLLVADAVFGEFSGNVVSGNMEGGVSLRDTDHVTLAGNVIAGNGINGVNLRDSRVEIRDNLIADNGERGIAAAGFSGRIRDNALLDNRLYAIGLDSAGDVDAASNWWGAADLAKAIYDHADEARLGVVRVDPPLAAAPVISWPLATVEQDTEWGGTLKVAATVTVPEGVSLAVKPGTTILFDRKAGLDVFGRLIAEGTDDARIRFTSAAAAPAPADWNEVRLEHAEGSRISRCDFEYATWGLHVHYVPMTIADNRFRHNDGGLRFRSGPYDIRNNRIEGNRIGMRAYLATAQIHANEITGNEIGIFIREKGASVRIFGNNMYNNDRYNLRLGDFNPEDVDARDNWWGTDSPAETIFDRRQEPTIGTVFYEPFSPAPLSLH